MNDIVYKQQPEKNKQVKDEKKMMKQQTNKSSCKFCEGAGESKEVYTSHWQFSKPVDGVLTCPKLLKYKCKNCDAYGHIEKRCPSPRKQNKDNKFCRFCYNAKKSEFMEHNQFDADGFVQCPALLAIECQECGDKGHTKRYCPKKNMVTEKATVEKPNVENIHSIKTTANKFASLNIEEEEDVVPVQNMTLFPMLTSSLGEKGNAFMLSGWAKAVSQRALAMPLANAMPSALPSAIPADTLEKLLARTPPPIPAPKQLVNSDSDSSSDEDDDEPYKPITSWADCE